MISPSSCDATSIKYLELKLISNSESNFTFKLSLPSPLLVLFTERSRLSFVRLNFTPSFLSRETVATRSTEFKKDFKSTSNFFLILFWYNLNIVWKLTIY